ncbi:hypothetical protein CYMTET_23834, partial [Cymbomonas tetramitiformis]
MNRKRSLRGGALSRLVKDATGNAAKVISEPGPLEGAQALRSSPGGCSMNRWTLVLGIFLLHAANCTATTIIQTDAYQQCQAAKATCTD